MEDSGKGNPFKIQNPVSIRSPKTNKQKPHPKCVLCTELACLNSTFISHQIILEVIYHLPLPSPFSESKQQCWTEICKTLAHANCPLPALTSNWSLGGPYLMVLAVMGNVWCSELVVPGC